MEWGWVGTVLTVALSAFVGWWLQDLFVQGRHRRARESLAGDLELMDALESRGYDVAILQERVGVQLERYLSAPAREVAWVRLVLVWVFSVGSVALDVFIVLWLVGPVSWWWQVAIGCGAGVLINVLVEVGSRREKRRLDDARWRGPAR